MRTAYGLKTKQLPGVFLVIATCLCGQASPAQQSVNTPQKDLTQVSIEDLMNTEVTSVSKKEQKLSRTAAAVFVITQEDIRRSGALNIPDLLRMVPGLDVAQINASTWAISARGLNDEFSNELLVLIDGRNVYTPTFGGVFWDLMDMPLEDIERIEVIRGPGGSVWGANAANGIISIVTKKAGETKGIMAVTGGGNLNQEFGTVQYGGELGKTTSYRVFSKYLNENHLPGPTGADAGDGWHQLQGGFRVDTTLSDRDSFTFAGNTFAERAGVGVGALPSVTSPGLVDGRDYADHSGGFLQSVWNHTYTNHADSTLNVSYQTYKIGNVYNTLTEQRRTVSLDFQYHQPWGSRQDFVWGLGYNYSASESQGDLTDSLNPANLATQIYSGFIQDEIALVQEQLYLTLGTKIEHNYYTGFGIMPTARVAYSLNRRQMLWAAVSRALRTPSSVDTALRFNLGSTPGSGGIPVLNTILGNPNFQNEGLVAYEAGYRSAISDHLSVDFAAFYNDYDSQQTTEPAAPFLETTPPPTHLVMPVTYENLMSGEEHGIEIAANWKVTNRWTISPGYDFARFHMHLHPGSQDMGSVSDTEGSDPHVQAQLRSHVDISKKLSWDTSAYFVDRLVAQQIPSYTRLDSNLSWQMGKGFSLNLVGQNLLQDHHFEFNELVGGVDSSLIKRSAYTKITWQF